jgi:hypothetical protein
MALPLLKSQCSPSLRRQNTCTFETKKGSFLFSGFSLSPGVSFVKYFTAYQQLNS